MNWISSTTSSRTFLSPREISRCSTCKEYLSVGPITQSSDSTYACGRCPAIGDDVEFYQTSTTLFMPCRFDIFGCSMFIQYKDVLWHENRCTYKPITCPAAGCNLGISKSDLPTHFGERHPDLILMTRDLRISILRSSENRVYVWKNRPLIVQTRITGTLLYIRITTIENEDIRSRRLYYRVTLLNKSVPLSLYSHKIPETNDMLKLDARQLGSIIYFDIYDRKYEKLTSKYLDNNSLSKLRCSICEFYTLPTTYTCQNRHNFCNTCCKRLQACSVCQTHLQKAFSFKHLGRFIELSCSFKHVGCNFVQTSEEITRHEQTTHVWNLSGVKYISIGEEIPLNLDIESFEETLYADFQETLLKIAIRYIKSIGMITSIVARDSQYVGLKYDLEASAQNGKLRFESQTVDIVSQNESEHYAKLDAKLLKYIIGSCNWLKLKFRLIAYR
nr:unnamed protein product [Callosobruchus analis]